MKNMIMLKINYRIDHGKRTIKNENKETVDHEWVAILKIPKELFDSLPAIQP